MQLAGADAAGPVYKRALTARQDSVIRKLSSMWATIRSNLFIGTVKVNVSAGTQGRAETSNIPNTHFGCSAEVSLRG